MSGEHGESWVGGAEDGQEGGSWPRKILRLLGLLLATVLVLGAALAVLTQLPYVGGPLRHHPGTTVFICLGVLFATYLIVQERGRRSGRRAGNQRREQRALRHRTEPLGKVSGGIASLCEACAAYRQENQLLRQRIRALEAGE